MACSVRREGATKKKPNKAIVMVTRVKDLGFILRQVRDLGFYDTKGHAWLCYKGFLGCIDRCTGKAMVSSALGSGPGQQELGAG